MYHSRILLPFIFSFYKEKKRREFWFCKVLNCASHFPLTVYYPKAKPYFIIALSSSSSSSSLLSSSMSLLSSTPSSCLPFLSSLPLYSILNIMGCSIFNFLSALLPPSLLSHTFVRRVQKINLCTIFHSCSMFHFENTAI